jgi:hypothetical protein
MLLCQNMVNVETALKGRLVGVAIFASTRQRG